MQLPEAHALDNAAADLGSGLDIRGLCRCVARPAVEKQAGVAARSENPKDKETDGSRLPQRGGGR